MVNPRRPFRINVGFIIHEEVGAHFEFPFEFEKVRLADDLELSGFEGTVEIGRTPQGLLVQGRFSGEMSLECVRCLTEFGQGLVWGLTELYAFNEKSVSDSGLIIPDDAQIDLGPLIREYALLEIPINPICRPDCKGLCPVCGQDLNLGDCGHHPPGDESPFLVLKKLL
ncbi:MAG TPA: DUF177 domain-containing protein [Anaerolineales bacterium]|nr:DUF177 domain-containing protein [Anaerolineales bacterium]